MDNKIVKKEEKEVAIRDNSIESLISQAINKNVPVETMEKLLAMKRQWDADRAKEAYDKAMSAFQGECPIIEKTKKVMNKDGRTVRYKFAPIDSIVEQVKPYLQKHGFSYVINTKINGQMTVICKVTHEAGHSETSEFSVPIDKEAYMNEAQKVASASTFAKRYAFLNAFGIMTGDEDDDSVSSQDEGKKQPQQLKKPTFVKDPNKPASDKQKWMIKKLMDDIGLSMDWLEKKAGSLETMKMGVASQVIEQLTKKQEKAKAEPKEDMPVIDVETGEIRDAEIYK